MPTPPEPLPWERPLGASPTPGEDGAFTFRVWSHHHPPRLWLRDAEHAMEDEGEGVYALSTEATDGERYAFVVDGERHPDPCTRHQPDGLRGPSAVVDPRRFPREHRNRGGVALRDLVLYELHVGTFTDEGTFDAAIGELPRLADLGVTAVEVMPVAAFPGEFGWGYDGVYPWATHDAYGGPHAFARFADAAHAHGLSVVLDVVHNHVGASGEQGLRAFGPYFTDKYSTFWGQAINFDDAWSDPVREWICQSAEWWMRDMGLDGLRLDAIHAIFDQRPEHLVAEVARRAKAANPTAVVIAESGLNDPKVVTGPERGGWSCDAAWADDLHHCVRTLVTDEREGYYAEFGTVADLAHTLRDPHLHDGRFSHFRERRFGAPARDVDPARFVVFDANHDQVGNRAVGDRLPREARPLAALVTLLSPYTPMLFMGEEHGDDAPFQFFADHIDEEIAIATRDGRRREFSSFEGFSAQDVPDPLDRATFERSKLSRKEDPAMAQLFRDLLAARKRLPSGHVDDVRFDEGARWLRFRRGPFEVLASFVHDGDGATERRLDVPPGTRLHVAAGAASVDGDAVVLGPLSGALVEVA
ncbi:malto-oligosyltrehalose trehalohydrolase [Conexibacter sp. SYSU D00693]|uniref:malto-oligosyltrehalose trehalohydrolase n=1 Tax=Conexibacter sp. SYSU D00693 TaxID=2812560 RepID=UPI00196BAC8E|nr:malto-oligosyltrehalose trehalohydrolase [Conexibacter sp. SYSU D00693]